MLAMAGHDGDRVDLRILKHCCSLPVA